MASFSSFLFGEVAGSGDSAEGIGTSGGTPEFGISGCSLPLWRSSVFWWSLASAIEPSGPTGSHTRLLLLA